MKKIVLLFAFFVGLAEFAANAQTARTVYFHVMDYNSVPLAGANLQKKGTSLGATTDMYGNATISPVTSGDIIVVSYIGATTSEVTITSANYYTVMLDIETGESFFIPLTEYEWNLFQNSSQELRQHIIMNKISFSSKQ